MFLETTTAREIDKPSGHGIITDSLPESSAFLDSKPCSELHTPRYSNLHFSIMRFLGFHNRSYYFLAKDL